MKTKFTFYQDPGHGWVKVPKQLLRILGISENITPYSYERNGYVYLEEDCDLSRFMGAFEEHFGVRPSLETTYTNRRSKIRSYQRYDAHYEKTRGNQFNS